MRLKRKKNIVKTAKKYYPYCFAGSGNNRSFWAAEWCILIQIGGLQKSKKSVLLFPERITSQKLNPSVAVAVTAASERTHCWLARNKRSSTNPARAAGRTDKNYVGFVYRGEDGGEAERSNPTPQSQNWVNCKQNYKSHDGAKFRICFFFYYEEKRKV